MPPAKMTEILSRTSFTWSAKLPPGMGVTESSPIAVFQREPGRTTRLTFKVENAPTTGRLFVSVRKDPPGNLSPWENVASCGVNPDGAAVLEVEPPIYYGSSDGPEVAFLRASYAAGNYKLTQREEPPTVRCTVTYEELAS